MTDVELVGNDLSLDFTNTVNARPSPSRDWLADGEQAAAWAGATGHDVDPSRLDAHALDDARSLREHLHDIFEPLTRDAVPDPQHLEALRLAHARAVRTARLARTTDGHFALSWVADGSLTPLISEVACAAMTLLARGRLDRLGKCPSCGWLFVDTSKNGRRRWCSMSTCGARDKARRHYRSRTTD